MSIATPSATNIADTTSASNKFTITLSIQNGRTSVSAVHAKNFLNNMALCTNKYPRREVWQSAVWPDVLRECQRVSIGIELSIKCSLADRLAMNHTLAGLLAFLDAASKVEFLNVQLLGNHKSNTKEILEVLQPIAIWARRMPDLETKLAHFSTNLREVMMDAKRSHSRTDDSIERLCSAIRIVARAAGRIHQSGLFVQIDTLNHEMSEIMVDVLFVSTASRERAESAIALLGRLLTRMKEDIHTFGFDWESMFP